MYLKQPKKRRGPNWRLRNWLIVGLLYGLLGLLWGQQQQSRGLLQVAAAPTPSVTVDAVNEAARAHMERADLYYDQGNTTAALESYEEAVAADPDLARAYARWGQLLVLRYRVDEALIRTERAVTLAPEDVGALAAHAQALVWAQRFPEAIRYAEEAIAAEPEEGMGYAFLAEAYIDTGQYEAALSTAQEAVALDPDEVWTWYILGYVNENLADYEAALAAYQEAIRVTPLSNIYNSIGRIYLNVQQDIPQAVEMFEEATVVDPRNPEAYAELSSLYLRSDDFASAQVYAEEGIAQDPTYGRNYGLLGQIYYRQLNFEAAIESLEQAVSFGYSNQLVYLYLGLAHAALEQCDEAVPWLERTLELNPEMGPARDGLRMCDVLPTEPTPEGGDSAVAP